jgi:arylsulfatase A-like enzyme
VSTYQSSTLDIFPTLADILDLPDSAMLRPADGMSLRPLFAREQGPRSKPIPIRHGDRSALIDNDYKLLTDRLGSGDYQLYDLSKDPREKKSLFERESVIAARMVKQLEEWNRSVEGSIAGRDYPEGRVLPGEPEPREWREVPEYEPYRAELEKRFDRGWWPFRKRP